MNASEYHQLVVSASDANGRANYAVYVEHPFGAAYGAEGLKGLGDLAFQTRDILDNQFDAGAVLDSVLANRQPGWPSERHSQGARPLNEQEMELFQEYFSRTRRKFSSGNDLSQVSQLQIRDVRVKLSDQKINEGGFKPEVARKVRVGANLSPTELAGALGIASCTIHYYESKGLKEIKGVSEKGRSYLDWLKIVSGYNPFRI